MNTNLFVRGFPYQTTQEELSLLFRTCGTVLSVKILVERETGRSRGIGFVEMSDETGARAAIAKLDGAALGSRKINVSEARPLEKRPGAVPGKPSPLDNRPGGFGSKPGFTERRSGKDRRAGALSAGPEPRRAAWTENPPFPSKFGFTGKKEWAKRPSFGGEAKKPWNPKPGAAGDKRKGPGGKKKWGPGGPPGGKQWGSKPKRFGSGFGARRGR